jgi:PleD family two-component response regulator
VHVTAGVAVGRPVDGDGFTELLVTADDDLYRAKRHRNPGLR